MNVPVDSEISSNGPPSTGANNAPEIWGNAPRVVKVGMNYVFTPQATDADGDPLTFSINNKPTWLTFNTSNGRISGIALFGNEGTYNDIEIVVSDGHVSTVLPRFSISIEPNTTPNMPPEIDGTPSVMANVEQEYSFTPMAFDPDGDNLTFSIQNKPGWARFATRNGTLSGMPQIGDVRSYSNILITVSDGVLSHSLPKFTITVIQVSMGSATLDWMPPTLNTDGSVLTDLAGFKIYYGTSLNNYSNQITINNPGVTTYVVDNLTPNTWYFVSTSFNTSGMESVFSNIATRTIE